MKMQAGIPLEFLLAFQHIPPEYQHENEGRNSAGIESDFWSRVKGKLSRVRVVCRG